MADDSLTWHLQPHLKSSAPVTSQVNSARTQGGVDNPALALSDAGDHIEQHLGAAQRWERFDEDDDDVPAVKAGGGELSGAPLPAATPCSNSEDKVERKGTSHPVYFDCRSGEAVVVPGDIAAVDSSGTYVIATRKIPERWRDMERPLRAWEMKLLKIFSVVAVFLFFPTGVPAVIFAWRTRREFDEGLRRGNIDGALKLARRTKALIILSGVLAITTGVLVYSLVERAAQANQGETGYLAHWSGGG